MTTIEKKVEIPENHRLLLDLTLPADIPTGEAEIRVTIIPTSPSHVSTKTSIIDSLVGLIPSTVTDAEVREERLKKHAHCL